MAQQITENERQGAEVYTGHDQCKQKIIEILQANHLPCGLLPLVDLEEVGYNRSTGLLWLSQKSAITHFYKKIGRYSSSGKEVTGYVADKKMARITGVKVKELVFWVSIAEIAVEDPEGEKIKFRTTTGIEKVFPVSAFELDE